MTPDQHLIDDDLQNQQRERGMTMKLTSKQIQAIRAAAPELADKLEAGEPVTVEREIKRWQPKYSVPDIMDRREVRAAMRLLAYREEFAPGYVVPPAGELVWFVYIDFAGRWAADVDGDFRVPTCVYMPDEVAEDLVLKLNSGEVVL